MVQLRVKVPSSCEHDEVCRNPLTTCYFPSVVLLMPYRNALSPIKIDCG